MVALGMEISEAQYERLARHPPVQRGNVSLSNLQVLDAILYVAERGCKWRGLPARFGNRRGIYTRMNRWSKHGVLDWVSKHLERERFVRGRLEAVSMDSTSIEVHPDRMGAQKKTTRHASASSAAAGPPGFIGLPRMLERPRRSRCPPDRPTMRRKTGICRSVWGSIMAGRRWLWTKSTRAMRRANWPWT